CFGQSNLIASSDPALWMRYNDISSHADCFAGTSAPNLQYIPTSWGGGGNAAPGTNPTVTSDNAVTGTGTKTAELKGEVTDAGGTDVIQRGVVWSESPNVTFIADPNQCINSEPLTGSTFTGHLHDLEFGKTYYVNTFAANSGGVSYGTERTYTHQKN